MDEQLVRTRTIVKRKFTQKVNILKQVHTKEVPLEVLKGIYEEVCEQFTQIEKINDKLAESIDV